MNEKNNTRPESKTSRLAVGTLAVPVMMFGVGLCIFEMGERLSFSSDSELVRTLGLFAIAWLLLCGPVGVVLGVLALHEIKNTKQELKGRRLAIEGMIIAIALECVFFVFVLATIGLSGR